MTAVEPLARQGARVLLLDARNRVLLFRGRDPARPDQPAYWFTVGGGVNAGETPVQAALREMAEETGLRRDAADLAGPVWHEVAEFGFAGRAYRQTQDFFVCRVEHWDVDTSAFDEVEVASIDRHRWWSADELEATDETYYPATLADLLRRLADGAR